MRITASTGEPAAWRPKPPKQRGPVPAAPGRQRGTGLQDARPSMARRQRKPGRVLAGPVTVLLPPGPDDVWRGRRPEARVRFLIAASHLRNHGGVRPPWFACGGSLGRASRRSGGPALAGTDRRCGGEVYRATAHLVHADLEHLVWNAPLPVGSAGGASCPAPPRFLGPALYHRRPVGTPGRAVLRPVRRSQRPAGDFCAAETAKEPGDPLIAEARCQGVAELCLAGPVGVGACPACRKACAGLPGFVIGPAGWGTGQSQLFQRQRAQPRSRLGDQHPFFQLGLAAPSGPGFTQTVMPSPRPRRSRVSGSPRCRYRRQADAVNQAGIDLAFGGGPICSETSTMLPGADPLQQPGEEPVRQGIGAALFVVAAPPPTRQVREMSQQ